MRRLPTRKLRAYVALAALCSLAGLAAGRPQLVALAAPLAAYVVVGLALTRAPRLAVEPSLARTTVLEGETLELTVAVTAAAGVELVELELRTGPGVLIASSSTQWSARLGGGERGEARFELAVPRWGVHPLGSLAVRALDQFGLIAYELQPISLRSVRAFPRRETLRRLLAPLELQATIGSRTARERGEGIEFAENRPFLPGDRLRRINWRVTARRGVPYVSERHPERNADVILFLDTFAEVGGEGGQGTLALAVRATTALASEYLARKDRVGVVAFGGMLVGVLPRLGLAQLYRIIDALLGSEVVFSYAHKDVSSVPRRLLPPKALVIGISPLLDDRYVGALLDLRGRGFDLTVVEVSPEPFVAPGRGRGEAVAHRLWLLQREALRARLGQLGVAVASWRDDEPLQLPIATAAELKRRQRRPIAA